MNLTRVAALLSSGLKPAQVATIIGCTPARISQLLQQEDFQLLLAEKQSEFEKEDIEEKSLTAKYIAAEHALIAQVMEMAPASELRDITAALRVVGDRQEKMKLRVAPPMQQAQSQVFVSISLPSHALAIPSVQRTTQNEIISIGDSTIAPLNANAVTNLFSAMKQKKEGDNNVPSTSTSSPEASPVKALEEEFINYGALA